MSGVSGSSRAGVLGRVREGEAVASTSTLILVLDNDLDLHTHAYTPFLASCPLADLRLLSSPCLHHAHTALRIACSAHSPRTTVDFVIYKLAKRVNNPTWLVALKALMTFHRLLRECDASFAEQVGGVDPARQATCVTAQQGRINSSDSCSGGGISSSGSSTVCSQQQATAGAECVPAADV